jgi:neurotransmitter:Na+ symporter, NSS family
MKRGVWASRMGFYMAAIGAAFGLGSLWRFPYVAEENGGGAFVFIYIVLLVLIGVPLLIGELMLGKSTKRSLMSSLRQVQAQTAASGENKVSGKLYGLIAAGALFACVVILSYYAVISGWVLHYLVHFTNLAVTNGAGPVNNLMMVLRTHGWLQILLASAHLLLVIIVVSKEFEEGLERFIGWVMPGFALILLFLMLQTLSLETATDALRFFFYPDFSRLKLESVGAAVGQLCFTLSIGFCTMVTFGSYLRDEVKVASTGFRVSVFDALTTILAGLLLFPLVFASPMKASGPELLFQTVPAFLLTIDGGKVFGMLFFLCLYLAAFGASLSILEGIVANLVDSFQIERSRAAWASGGIIFLLSLFPGLSSTYFSKVQLGGKGLLELMDIILINWVVPLIGLLVSQIVRFRLNEKIRRDEFIGEDEASMRIIYNHWSFLMKWVVPPVICLGIFLQIIALIV